MHVFGAGISPHLHLPSDLTVTITKEGDKPAQVTVQRKDEQWEVTEDELDELPADVRPHVERMLGRNNLVISAGPPPIHQPQQSLQLAPPPAVRKKLELRHETLDQSHIEQLRKELQELRKDVESLKEKAKPE